MVATTSRVCIFTYSFAITKTIIHAGNYTTLIDSICKGVSPSETYFTYPQKILLVLLHRFLCRRPACLPKKSHKTLWKHNPQLVAGWTNPFEKYARQIGFIVPKFSGWKFQKLFELPPPKIHKIWNTSSEGKRNQNPNLDSWEIRVEDTLLLRWWKMMAFYKRQFPGSPRKNHWKEIVVSPKSTILFGK